MLIELICLLNNKKEKKNENKNFIGIHHNPGLLFVICHFSKLIKHLFKQNIQNKQIQLNDRRVRIFTFQGII